VLDGGLTQFMAQHPVSATFWAGAQLIETLRVAVTLFFIEFNGLRYGIRLPSGTAVYGPLLVCKHFDFWQVRYDCSRIFGLFIQHLF